MEFLINVIGYLAAFIGSVMFMPQVIKTWKTKETKSLSLLSYSLLVAVSLLWLIYGILLMAGPIIVVNFILLCLSTFIVILKLRYP